MASMSSSDRKGSRPYESIVVFSPNEDEYRELRSRCAEVVARYNSLSPSASVTDCYQIFKQMLPQCIFPPFTNVRIPFYVDYGLRVYIDNTAFIDRGCKIVDTPVADIRIGRHCWIGPNVTITSVGPPCSRTSIRKLDSGRREISGAPVDIDDGAWIGASAVIGPGVTIGRGSVVAAGAVVLEDVPEYTEVCGNPAKMTRRIA
ncbi:trimeric LpxA-like protein [Hypomontagnella submonticulosa]|nr:trimeric LpxA-like protein [Hypomontagnella submonticulosa]